MLTKKGYVMKKSDCSDKVISDLTVCPFTLSKRPQYFKVYKETESVLRLPRYYGISTFGEPNVNKLQDGIKIDVNFQGSLKPELYQDKASERTLKQLYDEGGAILSLACGYGKTITSLYILCQLKVKTLVIVHKNVLVKQWKERISQVIPTATIGHLQQDIVDVNKDIVIAMLHSLCNKDYDLTKMGFGFVIVDECHHISCEYFSQSLFRICPKYILGLSATPKRKDGLTKVLYWFMNRISFSIERNQCDNVSVKVINYITDINGNKSVPLIINDIVEISERNEIIINEIRRLLLENRKILVLSDRREHCRVLQEGIGDEGGLYLGGMKQRDLDENVKKCSVLFATYTLAQEGLDIPVLDTLILSTPKSDVTQACGRILRETEGKVNNPYIVDIVDDCCYNMFEKRERFYKKYFNIIK